MKKLIVFIWLVMAVLCFAACGSESADISNLQIVTTIFPEYDWTMQILGEKADSADVTMLLDNGVDLHSYQPTAEDILKIANCDIFIYVGGESDSWAEDALKEATNKDMIVIDLMTVLGDSLKEEELVEGMQAEDESESEAQSEETEYDEHVWLSLKNSQVLCKAIGEALQKADLANAETYKENLDEYINKLTQLYAEYQKAVDDSKHKTLVFGDRFPFRYLADDYGIDYYAAFIGCSAETEASFETITFLANKIDELGITKVMTIDSSDHKLADTIISNTKNHNQEILTMDSLQSVTLDQVDKGASYLTIMSDNLKTLVEALK